MNREDQISTTNHTHDPNHDHNHGNGDTSNLRLAFFLNLGFTLLEIVGGLWTNSIAIQSDALHDLGDSISLGVAWYLGNVAEKTSHPCLVPGW